MSIEAEISEVVEAAVARALAARDNVQVLAYSTGQAATALGVSESKVRELVASGALPTIDGLGTRRLIPRIELERFVSESATTSSGSGTPPIHEHGPGEVIGLAESEPLPRGGREARPGGAHHPAAGPQNDNPPPDAA